MSILPSKPLTILHISDLHLVPGDIVEERGWRKLWKSLHNKLIMKESGWKRLWKSFSDRLELKDVDLCVISGDLPRHSPRKELYKALRTDLDSRLPRREGKRRWIAVPGNHDRRFFGNFFLDKDTFEKSLDEGWRQAWWDADYPCIVVPLDSNPRRPAPVRAGVALARGVLGDECNRMAHEFRCVQRSVATKIADALAEKPGREAALYAMHLCAAFDVDEMAKLHQAAYPRMGELPAEHVPRELIDRTAEVLSCLYMARAVKCVVFHHHPVGVRSTENISLTHQDAYELLADSGAFLQAARDNQISLVLHGHKHASHRIAVHLPGHDVEVVGIVGAGSSTGRSEYECATANLITINEAGEVEVELHEVCAHDSSEQSPKVQLRDWAHVRKHLGIEGGKYARYSAKAAQIDVSVLPDGDAIMTEQMRGLELSRKPGQCLPQVLDIPISYASTTQIGPVQVTCQIEERDSQLQQIRFHPHQEPGYGPGEWHGFVRIRPTDPEQPMSVTLTTRFIAFTTFAMNSWQASFMYANNEIPLLKENWYWRCGIPVRKQLFAALETTGDRASAFTFEKLYSTCRRIDDCVDEQERQEMAVDLAAFHQRVAFTVPMPVWGSEYGIGWEWGNQSTNGQSAPVFTGLREQLEIEADQARSGGPISALRSSLQKLLRKGSPELEATLHVLTRPTGADPGKLIQIAWNVGAEHSSGYEFEMNFGAGVAGRAASLQKTIAWVPKDPDAPSEEALVDFYLHGPRNHGHTGILAIPIPRRQPLAILSITSRESHTFSHLLQKILEGDKRNRTEAKAQFEREFAWIRDLAGEIAKMLKNVQSHVGGSERAMSKENHTSPRIVPHNVDERGIIAPGVAQVENRPWDDAISLVNPDNIQQRLRQFEINFYGAM